MRNVVDFHCQAIQEKGLHCDGQMDGQTDFIDPMTVISE